jgi:hypothetical protein
MNELNPITTKGNNYKLKKIIENKRITNLMELN